MKTAYLLLIAFMMLASTLIAFADEKKPTKDSTEKITLAVFVDVTKNPIKGNAIAFSGAGMRYKAIGIGYSTVFGLEPLEQGIIPGESNTNQTEYLRNLEGYFVYFNVFLDIKEINVSLVPLFGFGPVSGFQAVTLGSNGMTIDDPKYDNKAVLGLCLQVYPANILVLGVRYDTIHKFSIQLGIVMI